MAWIPSSHAFSFAHSWINKSWHFELSFSFSFLSIDSIGYTFLVCPWIGANCIPWCCSWCFSSLHPFPCLIYFTWAMRGLGHRFFFCHHLVGLGPFFCSSLPFWINVFSLVKFANDSLFFLPSKLVWTHHWMLAPFQRRTKHIVIIVMEWKKTHYPQNNLFSFSFNWKWLLKIL